jgi:hypothetical protein
MCPHWQEFEVREVVLLDWLAAKTAEHTDLSSRLADLTAQMDAKRAEGNAVAAAQTAVLAVFAALVEDKQPFVEALTHTFNRWGMVWAAWVWAGLGFDNVGGLAWSERGRFRSSGTLTCSRMRRKHACSLCGCRNIWGPLPESPRRIKRTKRQAGRAGGDGASDSGGSEDSQGDEGDSDFDSGDDGDYDDGAPEVCPPGCEQALFDRVCELREARQDEEDAAADLAKAVDALRKAHEVLLKKGRLMEQSLAAINQVGLPERAQC